MTKVSPLNDVGGIEQIGRPSGYRFSNRRRYAFYDVYWQQVSGKYLILEQYRFRNLFMHHVNWSPKPTNGPYPLEILESDTPEASVDRRCLEIMKQRLGREGLQYKVAATD